MGGQSSGAKGAKTPAAPSYASKSAGQGAGYAGAGQGAGLKNRAAQQPPQYEGKMNPALSQSLPAQYGGAALAQSLPAQYGGGMGAALAQQGAMGSNMANMAQQGAMGSNMANMAKQYAPQIGQMASTMAQRAPGIMNAALGNPVIDPARQAARQDFKAGYGQEVDADNRQQFRQDFRQQYNPAQSLPAQSLPAQSLPAQSQAGGVKPWDASTALMASGRPWQPYTREDKINSEQRTQDAAAKLGGVLGLQDPRYMNMIKSFESQGPSYAGGRAMPTWTPPWKSGG